jgi:hypothetical protein
METAGETAATARNERQHTFARKLGAGLAGALSLTAIHQVAQKARGDAPRMDKLGERALVRLCKAVGVRPPRGQTLYAATLVGDILANAAFYTTLLAGRAGRPWLRSGVGGALAGVGALTLPPLLGLGSPPRARRRSNRLMTVAWYALGGLASAAVYRVVARSNALHG